MASRNVVVIGASAGGLKAVEHLLRGLVEEFPAAVFVVIHMWPAARSHLGSILQKSCRLPVLPAEDGLAFDRGKVYVARPDHHLLVGPNAMRLTRGPRENRSRPAIDTLFRSAAQVHGNRVVGVVLTGALDDGTAGLWSIKDRGGTAVVQDPDEAEHSSMPSSAIAHVAVDHVVPVAKMGPLLSGLVREELPRDDAGEKRPSKALEIETAIAREAHGLQIGVMKLGAQSTYTCPECRGTMVRVEEGAIPRFRCHTGHAFTISTLLAEVTESMESRLWECLRAVEEGILLLKEAARHIRDCEGDASAAADLERRVKLEQERANELRATILKNRTVSEESESVA